MGRHCCAGQAPLASLLTEARRQAPDHGNAATEGSRTATARFGGFGIAGLAFLAGLELDNSKEFFDAHRDVYRRDLLEPSKALVVALGERLRRRVCADPSLILRITPAEIHLGAGVVALTGAALDPVPHGP